jgi:3-phosphoshikimate 1-carboxyvinyltransferase
MGRVVKPLTARGAKILGREGGTLLPVEVIGTELSGNSRIDIATASAQVKSALMLSHLFSKGTIHLKLPRGARRHTETMLRWLGAKLEVVESGGYEEIFFDSMTALPSKNYVIPGDPSSAAFVAALAAVHPGLQLHLPKILCSEERFGFFDALQKMGVKINRTSTSGEFCGEAVCDLDLSGGESLSGIKIPGHDIPSVIDEIPILAVVASQAEGKTQIEGCGELRVKESDRFNEILNLLSLAGVRVESAPEDSLIIYGNNKKLNSFAYDCKGDHRMAMSAIILSTLCSGPCNISGCEAIDVSFPGFIPLLHGIYAHITDEQSV